MREAARLERDRDARAAAGLFLAWGLHLAEEALETRAAIVRAFVDPALASRPHGAAILARLAALGVERLEVRPALLDGIAAGAGDQGLLLLIRRPTPGLDALFAVRLALAVGAHGVQDPGNVGTLARSARAFGSAALLAFEETADPFGSRAVRAGMGAHFRLPIATVGWKAGLDAARAGGMRIVAADLAGQPIAEADLGGPLLLVVGGEGSGLPAALRERADLRVRIPMASGSESLNVQTAAAVLLYEIARRRGFAGLDARA
ncbi:MAG TPA: RNA methyltransferase [Dongiaceae bacterium]|nr:RNA methyltransferase [Dongiaceae bacterium]